MKQKGRQKTPANPLQPSYVSDDTLSIHMHSFRPQHELYYCNQNLKQLKG